MVFLGLSPSHVGGHHMLTPPAPTLYAMMQQWCHPPSQFVLFVCNRPQPTLLHASLSASTHPVACPGRSGLQVLFGICKSFQSLQFACYCDRLQCQCCCVCFLGCSHQVPLGGQLRPGAKCMIPSPCSCARPHMPLWCSPVVRPYSYVCLLWLDSSGTWFAPIAGLRPSFAVGRALSHAPPTCPPGHAITIQSGRSQLIICSSQSHTNLTHLPRLAQTWAKQHTTSFPVGPVARTKPVRSANLTVRVLMLPDVPSWQIFKCNTPSLFASWSGTGSYQLRSTP